MNTDPIHLRYRHGCIFSRQIGASADISAPIGAVWDALTDFEHYGDWNVFTPKITTDLQVGSKVVLHVNMPNRSRSVRTKVD